MAPKIQWILNIGNLELPDQTSMLAKLNDRPEFEKVSFGYKKRSITFETEPQSSAVTDSEFCGALGSILKDSCPKAVIIRWQMPAAHTEVRPVTHSLHLSKYERYRVIVIDATRQDIEELMSTYRTVINASPRPRELVRS